jgi:formylglycine-generating enzyme required for sulfatase activity
MRVVRGGSWNFSGVFCAVAHRDGCEPSGAAVFICFRVVSP